jgi:hypothetical protein
MTTSIKTCFKCKADKPNTEFYKHPETADGYLGKCKECTRADTKAAREETVTGYNPVMGEWARRSLKTINQQREML